MMQFLVRFTASGTFVGRRLRRAAIGRDLGHMLMIRPRYINRSTDELAARICRMCELIYSRCRFSGDMRCSRALVTAR